MSLDKSTVILNIGESVEIKATVNPNNIPVSWLSGDGSIAYVGNGIITGISPGTSVIIAKADGQEQRCTVVVNQSINFNPSIYEAEAIQYGKSLGLIYDENYVSKGNWNPWINLNSELTEAQMMQNIRDSLQILVNEGREYFFVYCERQTNNSYHMFIFFG